MATDGAALDGSHRRRKAGRAADRGHDPVGRPRGGLDRPRRSPAPAAIPVPAKCVLERGQPSGSATAANLRVECDCCLRKRLDIALRRDRLDPVAIRLTQQQIDRACTDRSGRTENADAARRRMALALRCSTDVRCCHSLPHQKRAARRFKPPRATPEKRRDSHGKDETIEPVHDTAMSGYQSAGSLALKRRFSHDSNRSPDCDAIDSTSATTPIMTDVGDDKQRRDTDRRGNRDDGPANRAGPCLLRADGRGQFRSAESAPGEIAADIGSPHDRKKHQDCSKAVAGIGTQGSPSPPASALA